MSTQLSPPNPPTYDWYDDYRLLAGKGYDVRTAGTAGEALKLYDEVSFDLMISDIGLPDSDGWQLLHSRN